MLAMDVRRAIARCTQETIHCHKELCRMPARKKAKVVKENSERWLLTYSDLITLLLIFFIILYSISSTNARKFQDLTGALQQAFNNGAFQMITPGGTPGTPKKATGQMSAEQKMMSRIHSELMLLSKELGISPQSFHVGASRDGIVITLAGGLLFYPGDTQLRPQSAILLSRIASLMVHIPNPIRVRGYTDALLSPDSIYQSNWALSSLRAAAIVEQLSTQDGIAPQRLDAEGYAQYRPVASNRTPQGRSENRRAEIVIVYH